MHEAVDLLVRGGGRQGQRDDSEDPGRRSNHLGSRRTIPSSYSMSPLFAVVSHCHTVLKSCLRAAVRKKLLARNPIDDVETVPIVDKFDHDVLDDTNLAKLGRVDIHRIKTMELATATNDAYEATVLS